MQKRNKGITLVALVITIIILLILAGITINLTVGQKGILTRAQEAGRNYQEAARREDEQLANFVKETNDIINENNNPNNDEKVDEILRNGGKYIYNEGKILEEASEFIGTSQINSEYAINEKNLYMTTKQGDGYNLAYIGTKNRISLEGYTKIKCLVSTGDNAQGYSNNIFKLVLLEETADLESKQYESTTIGANQTDYILEFEVPDDCFNKEYHIGAMGTLQNVYIYKIWLEKSETKILYDYGKKSEEVEGFIGVNDVNSEYAIHEKDLFMTTKGDGYNFAYIGTKNKIDLTGYNKIRCFVSTGDNTQGYASNVFNIAIQEEMPDKSGVLYKTSRTIGANQTGYYLSFTIPDECKNNKYYIGVAGTLQNIYVYKIWLEK